MKHNIKCMIRIEGENILERNLLITGYVSVKHP